MIDTEMYFTTYDLQESSVRLDFICNNSNNIQIAIGYKSPTIDLMSADNPTKEIIIWSGEDNFPKSSSYYKSKNEEIDSRITKEWDLLSLGFTTEEYVKADERIWYLRINGLSNGPYGYEKNITQIINGTEYLIPEFIPHINYVEKIELTFGDLCFTTLLYPFFDGSCDIVIPIRGVNHELAVKDDEIRQKLGLPIKGSWTTTTTSGGFSNDRWAVVFATENYKAAGYEDQVYFVFDAYVFIMGEHPYSDYRHTLGIFDYGWSVIYCMDCSEEEPDELPTKTCEETDDDFFNSMMSFADTKVGNYDQLIVWTHGHGDMANGGKHHTLSGKSRWILGPTNTIKYSEYQEYIGDVTYDGTYVFLWVLSCEGYCLQYWSATYHHYRLEVWNYIPQSWGQTGTWALNYRYAVWLYHQDLNGDGDYDDPEEDTKDSECERFFDNWELSYPNHITTLGNAIELYFNTDLHPEIHDKMYTTTFWGSYEFYL